MTWDVFGSETEQAGARAFQRRVAEQRAREMEEAAIAMDRPIDVLCRVCGRRLSETKDATRTVCTKCGGFKTQARLEQDDRARAAEADYQRSLLKLVFFPKVQSSFTQEANDMARKCEKCGEQLHGRTKGELCPDCRDEAGGEKANGKAAGADVAGLTPASAWKGKSGPKAGGAKDIQKRFRIVATELGYDPTQLINDFCKGWLDELRSNAPVPKREPFTAGASAAS